MLTQKMPPFSPMNRTILQKWQTVRAEFGLKINYCPRIFHRLNKKLYEREVCNFLTVTDEVLSSAIISLREHHDFCALKQLILIAVMEGKVSLDCYSSDLVPRQYVDYQRQRTVFKDKLVAYDLLLFLFHRPLFNISTLAWAQKVTDKFLSAKLWTKATTYGEVRFYTAYLIRWLSLKYSISDFSQILPSHIHAFYRASLHNYYNNCIAPFIMFLVNQRLLPPPFISLCYFHTHKYILPPDHPIYDTVQSGDVSPTRLYNASVYAEQNLDKLGFSRFTREKVYTAVPSYCLFLIEHNLNASVDSIVKWCRAIDKHIGRYPAFGFPIYATYMLAVGKECTLDDYCAFNKFILKRPRAVRAWAISEYKGYKEKCLQDRDIFIHSDLNRFIEFMHRRRIRSFSELTSQLLTDYVIKAKHSSSMGKYRSLCSIRKFLIYLADCRIIKYSTAYSIPITCVKNRDPIKVLSDEQIDAVKKLCKKSNTKDESTCRLILFIQLALLTGLRKIDINSLKLENIDANKMTISIIQHKTKVALTLPLPTQTLQSVINYLSSRPDKSHNSNIMLSLRAPFPRVEHIGLSARDMKKINAGYFTAHMLRRTFASCMLNTGADCQLVSQMLGHSDIGTLQRYLSTSEDRLRSCSLSLDGLDTEVI